MIEELNRGHVKYFGSEQNYLDFLNNKNRSSAVREIAPEKREEFNKIKEEYLKILNKE